MYNDPTYCYCEYLHRDLLFVTGSLKAHVSSLNGPNHQSHNVRMESATPPLRRRRERARRDKRGRKSHEGRRWRKRERDETWTNTPLEKYCRSWEGRRNVCLCRSFMPASVATGPDPESDQICSRIRINSKTAGKLFHRLFSLSNDSKYQSINKRYMQKT